jgi:membrane-bound ClpP family serine protease
MWVVAAMLLSAVVLAALAGLHTGPHTHLGATLIGAIAAAWLVVMAVDGTTRAPLLFGLLAADIAVSGLVGFAAWAGLTDRGHTHALAHGANAVIGSVGIAVSELAPSGIVRVKGENWSASSMNGTIAAGSSVQVLHVDGIRLEVWGEDVVGDPAAAPFRLGPAELTDSSATPRSDEGVGPGGPSPSATAAETEGPPGRPEPGRLDT